MSESEDINDENKRSLKSFVIDNKIKVVVGVLAFILLVAGAFVTIGVNNKDSPESEYFEQFNQKDTKNGYNYILQVKDFKEYDHIVVTIENVNQVNTARKVWDKTKSYGTYNDVKSLTESKKVLLSQPRSEESSKLYHKTAYALVNTEDIGVFTSIPEGAILKAYGASKIENGWKYTQIKSHAVTGDDPSYTATITVESMPEKSTALLVKTRTMNEATKLSTGESIKVTNTEGANVRYQLWYDADKDGKVETAKDGFKALQTEILHPSNQYVFPAVGTGQNIKSLNGFSYKGLTVSVTVEKVK